MMEKGFLIKFVIFLLLTVGLALVNPLKISKEEAGAAGSPSLIKIAFDFVADEHSTLKGENRDRINVLFLGMTGVPYPAPFLTDSIIVASIRPSTSQLSFLSLPRDLLVSLPNQNTYTKINALFAIDQKDPSLIRNKVEEITGQPIDYVMVFDVSAVETIVDTLGGLNVLVPEDVNDPHFPSENGGTETFSVQKGWRYFDGKTAERYLRTRHSDEGDFARMRQQQAVLEALRKKVFGLNLLYDLPTILSIYKTIAAHFQTDIDESAVKRFYDIGKTIRYDHIIEKVVDGDPKNPDSLLISKTFTLGGEPAFVLVPKTGNFDYDSIREVVQTIFN